MNNTPHFDGDTWKFKALMDFAAYKELAEFAASNAAIQAYTSSHHIISTDMGAFSENQIESLRNAKKITIEQASEKLGCQTIISLCTTFEVVIREFLKCFFYKNPTALFAYIGPDHAKGYISLKDILNAKSHADLIVNLASDAAGIASKGKYGQVFNRIRKLCKLLEATTLPHKLDSLQSKRNKIVHERSQVGGDFASVLEAHSIIDEALESLCELGLSRNIPGDYSCIQPVNFELLNFALLQKK